MLPQLFHSTDNFRLTKILHEGVRFIEQGHELDPNAKKQRARMLTRALRKLGYEVAIRPTKPRYCRNRNLNVGEEFSKECNHRARGPQIRARLSQGDLNGFIMTKLNQLMVQNGRPSANWQENRHSPQTLRIPESSGYEPM